MDGLKESVESYIHELNITNDDCEGNSSSIVTNNISQNLMDLLQMGNNALPALEGNNQFEFWNLDYFTTRFLYKNQKCNWRTYT